MQQDFKGKTLLCIAQRLKAIGYDRMLLMDAGRIAELDAAGRLFELDDVFRGMCERSGIRRDNFADLVEMDVREGKERTA